MKTSVNELLKQIRENDSKAFDELVSEYEGLIRSLINGFAKDTMTREDVEDMEQEAKMSLLRAARTYDFGSGLTFGLYAKICIKNGLVSHQRKQNALMRVSDVEIESIELSVPDTTLEVDENESAEILLKKLKVLLSNTEIKVLNFRLMDLNRAQIAEKLGTNVKAVDNAVSRIKQKLKTLLS